MYNLILKEVKDNQKTWYNSGIGTYARPSWKSLKFYKQVLFHKIDLAIAWLVVLEVSSSYAHAPWRTQGLRTNRFRRISLAFGQLRAQGPYISFRYVGYNVLAMSQLILRNLGFSRGAFQVRVLSAMIDKV